MVAGFRGAGRWSVVAAGVAALSALPTVVQELPAGAASESPRRLLARLVAGADQPYEGLAEVHGNLGLPELPRLEGPAALLSTTTRLRVWWDSPQHWRVAELLPVSERNTYRDGDETTTYDYGPNEARTVLGSQPIRSPRAADLTPPSAVARLLGGIGPADVVTSLPARRIGGHAAVGVRVRPADPRTTVGTLDAWADRSTMLPLRVEVSPRAATRPAFVTEFLAASAQRPSSADLARRIPGTAESDSGDDLDPLAIYDRAAPWLLPQQLAGLPRTDGRATGVAVYGRGLVEVVVVPVSTRRLRRVTRAATGTAGTESVRYRGGTGLAAHTPLVQAALAQANEGSHAYLVGGSVSAAVVTQVVVELFAANPHER